MILLKINLFLSWYSWRIAELALNNNTNTWPLFFLAKWRVILVLWAETFSLSDNVTWYVTWYGHASAFHILVKHQPYVVGYIVKKKKKKRSNKNMISIRLKVRVTCFNSAFVYLYLGNFYCKLNLFSKWQCHMICHMIWSCKCFSHISKTPTLTYQMNNAIIKNAIIWKIIHTIFNLSHFNFQADNLQ
jgi:hypothetical protein